MGQTVSVALADAPRPFFAAALFLRILTSESSFGTFDMVLCGYEPWYYGCFGIAR